jgi:hypothetical protein
MIFPAVKFLEAGRIRPKIGRISLFEWQPRVSNIAIVGSERIFAGRELVSELLKPSRRPLIKSHG